MANEIKDKFTASTALTITLASLASSVVGVGRQSDMIDNSTNRYQRIKGYVKARLGSSPAAGSVYVYALRGDKNGTPYRTDGAGASDAALTVLNAPVAGIARTKSSPATGDDLYVDFEILSPGPEWGLAVVQDSGVNLDSTAGNLFIHWVGVDPEIQ